MGVGPSPRVVARQACDRRRCGARCIQCGHHRRTDPRNRPVRKGLTMAKRQAKSRRERGLISKIRKPIAPASRVIEDPTKYKRERELEKLRREEKSGNSR